MRRASLPGAEEWAEAMERKGQWGVSQGRATGPTSVECRVPEELPPKHGDLRRPLPSRPETQPSLLGVLECPSVLSASVGNPWKQLRPSPSDWNNNWSHSLWENALNLFTSCCLGIEPPRGGLHNNNRGNRRKSFHPRHCEISSLRSTPFAISCRANLIAARYLPLKNRGGDRMTDARRQKMPARSTVSNQRSASRRAGPMDTSTTDGSASPSEIASTHQKFLRWFRCRMTLPHHLVVLEVMRVTDCVCRMRPLQQNWNHRNGNVESHRHSAETTRLPI